MTADASQLTDAAAPASGALAATARQGAARRLRARGRAAAGDPLLGARRVPPGPGDRVVDGRRRPRRHGGQDPAGRAGALLDTGYHFAETIGTRDAVATVYPVDIVTVLPLATVAEQDAEHGPDLWQRQPDLCCALRKVEPLARGLSPYTAWASHPA
jgi:hypothetical protein